MLGVSIVAYHSRADHIGSAVESLVAQGIPVHLVHVHVNDDADGSCAAELRGLLPDGVVVSGGAANIGFAGGHNRLLAALFARGADRVVVHNPDLVLEPGAVDALAAAAAELGPALLGPLLELADPDTLAGTGRIDTAGIRWTRSSRHLDDRQGEPLVDLPTDPYAVPGLSGACLLVPRAAHDAVVAATGEFFDEDFVAYREDAELGLRAERIGIPCYVVPAARGRHARQLRGTSRSAGVHANRLSVQNRFLIAWKYGARRPGTRPATLTRDVVVVLGVVLREWSSLPGLASAWRLRGRMRAKAQVLDSLDRMSRSEDAP